MNRPSGGIIFTTIQKFGLDADEDNFPVLTDRHNIVVIADEAHRTQYGFKAKIDSAEGPLSMVLAKSLRDGLPNATFLAFTGHPSLRMTEIPKQSLVSTFRFMTSNKQ